jgi:two-component system, LytTR family, response regulator
MNEARPMNCVIVDDEPAAREVLKRYIVQLPALHLAAECSNALQVMQLLQQQTVDLLFLDIHMPQLNGNDLLRILKHPPAVIFTTAHPEYALEGYELDAVDYLLKPVSFERFLKAVQKAMPHAADHESPPAIPRTTQPDAFIYFRADRKMIKVLLKDILYIESMKDYVKVFTTGGVIVTKQSISSLEELLPEHLFVRTHRSFIVSLQKIRTYTHELIEIEQGEVPIGKLYRNAVLKVLG